jgi:hypothetical protein
VTNLSVGSGLLRLISIGNSLKCDSVGRFEDYWAAALRRSTRPGPNRVNRGALRAPFLLISLELLSFFGTYTFAKHTHRPSLQPRRRVAIISKSRPTQTPVHSQPTATPPHKLHHVLPMCM